MSETKYFAYYIPENIPVLMNNINDYLFKKFGLENSPLHITRIMSNINNNDWYDVSSDNIHYNINNNLKSLVLVKFTNIGSIFINNSLNNNSLNNNNNSLNNNCVNNSVDCNIIAPELNLKHLAVIEQDGMKYYRDVTNNYVYEIVNGDDIGECIGKYNIITNNVEMFMIFDKNNYTLIAKNEEFSRNKIQSREGERFRNRLTLFSGSNKLEYNINRQNYILSEIIIIPIAILRKAYSNIYLDNINEFKSVYKFDTSIQKYIDDNTINTTNIYIFRILNEIIKNYNNFESENYYKHSKKFMPLLNNIYDNHDIVKELWNLIMVKYNDPLAFLQNHKLIIDNTLELEYNDFSYSFNQNIDPNNTYLDTYKIKSYFQCKLNAKVYITEKKFADITYKDALPYQNCFICNETNLTQHYEKHNTIAQNIRNMEHQLEYIQKINADKHSADKQLEIINQTTPENLQRKIENNLLKLTPVDEYYEEHILQKTNIGINVIFNDALNGFTSLLYLRMAGMNIDKLDMKIMFKCEFHSETSYIKKSYMQYSDIFKLYIHNDLLKDILSLKVKADLFTISRLFKMNTINKYENDKELIECINPETILLKIYNLLINLILLLEIIL
jgi:hypothetical protein